MDEYRINKMKISLINQQNNYHINNKNILNLSKEFGLKIQSEDKDWDEITIILTDHKNMINLNNKYFNKENTTDVISFTYDPIPGEQQLLCGDIIVNLDMVIEEGKRRSNVNYELAFYIAHGFDHLSGNNDNTPLKRKKMHAREKKWIEQAAKYDLLDDLIA